jgi:hypothetical protein
MFALPDPSVTLSPLIVTVTIGLAVVIAFSVFRFLMSRPSVSTSPDSHAASDAQKCRYCRRGEAVLREDTVRLDGEDLVGVRCYVCSSCGLPQWWVERRGISPRVR